MNGRTQCDRGNKHSLFAKMATDRAQFVPDSVCAHQPNPYLQAHECAYHNFVVYLHIPAACNTTMEIRFHAHAHYYFSGNAASNAAPGLVARKLCHALGRMPAPRP